jgi:DNA-binding NtrC family response regulator
MKRQNQSSSTSPVIYAVDREDTLDFIGTLFDTRSLPYRTFSDPQAAFEAFVSAAPRPTLLVTAALDHALSGLQLVPRYKEVAPTLRVVLLSGHPRSVMASALAEAAWSPDAMFTKGSEFDAERFLDRIEELVKGSATAPPVAAT